MKLSIKQLKQIIKEEVNNKPGPFGYVHDTGERGRESLAVKWTDEWSAAQPFDEEDPTAGPIGPDSWDEQVAKAALELSDRLEELLNEIESKLHDGEYSEAGGF